MPARKPAKSTKKAVVGDLHELQCRFVIRCKTCAHQVTYSPAEAAAAFGFNRPVADLRAKLKCTRCEARGDQLEMGLHEADRQAMNRREGLDGRPHPEALKSRSPGNADKYPQRTRGNRMSWQGTLTQMKACGTFLYSTCSTCREHHEPLDIDQLIGLYGPETDLWDRWSECPTPGCKGKAFFIASPGQGTPARPLMTSLVLDPWVDEPVALERAIRRKRA